jgi:hypothetical protein
MCISIVYVISNLIEHNTSRKITINSLINLEYLYSTSYQSLFDKSLKLKNTKLPG